MLVTGNSGVPLAGMTTETKSVICSQATTILLKYELACETEGTLPFGRRWFCVGGSSEQGGILEKLSEKYYL